MSLDQNDLDVIYQCLKAIDCGPFLEDFEFHSRIGLDRKQLKGILSNWPIISLKNPDVILAISNCLNEICFGVPISNKDWSTWFKSSRDDVTNVYKKWSAKNAADSA